MLLLPIVSSTGSCYWVSEGLFMSLIDNIIEQLKRAGFKVVFADGHGPSRNSWVNHLIEREVRFGLKLLGVTKDFRQSWQSQMDHAAENETSLVMALRPDLVDLSQLPEDKSVWPQGVGGSDPRQANAIAGQSYLKSSIETLRQALNEVSY